jgi:hypothetical protein
LQAGRRDRSDSRFVDEDEDSFPEACVRLGKKRGRPASDGMLVDVTHLLVLPQRDAALILGVSESMLCKRFKEVAKIQWPHRRVVRLDKKIATTKQRLLFTGSRESNAMEILSSEREMLLQPVLIRMTRKEKSVPNDNYVADLLLKLGSNH